MAMLHRPGTVCVQFNLEVEEIGSAQEEVQQLRRLTPGPLVLQVSEF